MAVSVDWSRVDVVRREAKEAGNILKGNSMFHASEGTTSLAVSRMQANAGLLSHLPVNAHAIHERDDTFARSASASVTSMITIDEDDEAV